MMPRRMVRLAVQLKSERKRKKVAGKRVVGLMVPKMVPWMALKRADC